VADYLLPGSVPALLHGLAQAPVLASFLGVDLEKLLKAVGYPGLFAIIFAESGLLVGIMLPGDSLLFTAGFLASQGFFNVAVLAVICIVAAISGDAVGYTFGRRVGRRLFERPDSRFFKQKHLHAAEAFYEKHGGKAILLARFIPIVRTLAPIVAGVSDMHYPRFAVYNIAGGILWGAGVTLGGYLLGETIPSPDRYLLPVIFAIVVISLLPTVLHVGRSYWLERRRLTRG
jgi:membrane-associated protein